MEGNHDIQCKPKRRRFNPVHKWNAAEEKALVEFLMEIEVSRNQRLKAFMVYYNKAKELELSTGAGSMEGNTIKNTLRKMYFFYEELDDIFGSRLNCSAVVEDSLLTLLESDSTSQSGAECVVEAGSSVEAEELQSPALNDNVCTRRQKGIYSKTALSDSLQVHGEIAEIRKQKLKIDVAAREREMSIKEKELELKEKEIELKEEKLMTN
ncbi:uncharacterized protein LOC120779678 isoform X2 [Bactrocera tryoni]|uniref:uncharacterized protein LOC120779678 isoform X2 n=1 Tax=Bactrocera tryoni TaxID=59916 RepID=UPI001A974DEA|nr:uncharacterized protein LOC120779678 isoform X2 [Bactrocera tryoni]